jgi:hypothetical protein
MNFETKIRMLANMQKAYADMVATGKVTKKQMCDICIPVRDALNLSDLQTLQIAREEMSLNDIINLLDDCKTKRKVGLNSLSDNEYELLTNIAKNTGMDCWFQLAASGTRIYVYDLEDNKELSLVTGVKLLLEGISPQYISLLSAADKNTLQALCTRLTINITI